MGIINYSLLKSEQDSHSETQVNYSKIRIRLFMLEFLLNRFIYLNCDDCLSILKLSEFQIYQQYINDV